MVGVAGVRGVGKQAGLPHEQSLDLQQRVAVLAQQAQRRAARKALEGVAVDAEAQRAGQRHIAHIFPTAMIQLQQLVGVPHLAVQTLKGQPLHPLGDGEVRHL